MTRSEIRALREKFAGGRPLSSRETFALFDTLDLILAEVALQKTELQIISAAITERNALKDEVRNLRASLEVADSQWTQAQRELDAGREARISAERELTEAKAERDRHMSSVEYWRKQSAEVLDLLREAASLAMGHTPACTWHTLGGLVRPCNCGLEAWRTHVHTRLGDQ